VCQPTNQRIKSLRQKGENILSYFVLMFNRCKDENTYSWGGSGCYLMLGSSQESSVKEVQC
jgi:hypothetical protein